MQQVSSRMGRLQIELFSSNIILIVRGWPILLTEHGPRERAVAITISFSEPVFLNVYGAPESILRNEFRQPM
jgi:hypothetical protein